ncbi:MAG: hypothetical protein A3C08_01700 [Candidatus Taylorbacteria bacterium RIFCSPHIGHO2_02_FULL_47_18]|uniref:EfeO-type cupredoxin-like domain-containing protein n=1 Tax=Candidatus Taylorbacteria bacterium RIFCSPLOWO2_01_FULL_48_100 TaxID=1802322 RepID=A0A1G2NHW7_9BACT|nr:MAG: hypothetical protein A2670_01290 [Candidatus Taylorbacteria bacterium RIFCSPHIGHO2_01_FULL_48_38]OHA28464.1 MAG: hypothetical protein A3C08_01700 [Candidatus Taylorbacteria bacterium RIFCSPHIGHO2_02_FULL_47_18]OHA34932.1 MAG: hypothetical protein A2938_02190 [Candidatus Taylorbacteria bacterium RIFCSPLOWO2_01_FULL_48_100]OHA40219.1 MAG: hypothetical protein A3J31_01410 [Candidatus Taylorbacteria bacterium RIFCSPLOWO2_02_FULL_48_16]OHA45447.1 MAG: hypothetical protein A3H13_01435 [Candid
MNKIALSIVTLSLVVALGIIFSWGSEGRAGGSAGGAAQNVETREGVQYITINARGGYSPRVSYAKADIPTKLIVKTNGTYDCSAALVIRALGFQKILSPTGEEIIDIGTPKAGAPLQGLCSMGMYSFLVNFK